MTRTLPLALLLTACASVSPDHGIAFKDADTWTYEGETYRLDGYDAPEKDLDQNPSDNEHTGAQCLDEQALSALAVNYAKTLLKRAESVSVKPTGRDCSWGRKCADIVIDGDSYTLLMVQAGYVQYWPKPYTFETRPKWCK